MNSKLWYTNPAKEWKEGLPIGNGVLAGMVLGGVEHERIALNHELLWRAQNRYIEIEIKGLRLDEIRQLFMDGKDYDAGVLANQMLGGGGGVSGTKNRIDPYQPLGDLLLDFPNAEISDYRRELDLETGVVTISYVADGCEHKREIFAHASKPVIVMRLSFSRPSSLTASLSRIDDPECVIHQWSKLDSFGFGGKFIEGLEFASEVKVLSTDGIISECTGASSISVKN